LITRRSSGEETAIKALCSIALLPVGSISQYVCPISHTHTHTNTYAFCSANTPSQWSSKPPACFLLLPDELCSSNQQGTQGSCKGFCHCISGEWSWILGEEYRKKCTCTNLEARADASLGAVSCASRGCGSLSGSAAT